jgi:hypothetical protein
MWLHLKMHTGFIKVAIPHFPATAGGKKILVTIIPFYQSKGTSSRKKRNKRAILETTH